MSGVGIPGYDMWLVAVAAVQTGGMKEHFTLVGICDV